jgi:hypothetical protein
VRFVCLQRECARLSSWLGAQEVSERINLCSSRDTLAGWVEDWRHTPQVQPIRCSPFPLGVPHLPNRKLGSSPRHFKPIVPISSNGLTWMALSVGFIGLVILR